ncbi:MAG: hypothetical protein WAM30_10420 [Candidatus Dormiibacterota bacterium]
MVTGLGFLIWGLAGRRHDHAHDHGITEHRTEAPDLQFPRTKPPAHGLGGRLAAIVVPFGVAASPDLTILPVAFAAAGYGTASVLGVLAISPR